MADDQNKEIEEILKQIEQKKNYHLLQTNINERDDLSQELDLLIYEKLKVYLNQQTPINFFEYIRRNNPKDE